MELAFPWPMSDGEWLAWWAAVATLLLGLLALFAPRLTLRMLRLRTDPDHPEAVAEVRSGIAGFYLGLALACILFAQPMLYLALGLCWAFTAFGRMVSMMSDRGGTVYNWTFLALDIALAALPLAYGLRLVA